MIQQCASGEKADRLKNNNSCRSRYCNRKRWCPSVNWRPTRHLKSNNPYVEISDTGCGIPEKVQVRIFEPFFTTKKVGKGTGLGMSISYEIIKEHGGEIQVVSVVGEGTSFMIRLPLNQCD